MSVAFSRCSWLTVSGNYDASQDCFHFVCLYCKSLNVINAQIVSYVLLHVAHKQNKEAFDGF